MNGDAFLHHVFRRKRQKQKVNEKVPSEDVLTEILIRLPAKQIARMRCVCKRWNRLLSEPYFIKSHIHRNLIRNKNKDNEILLVLTFLNVGMVFDGLTITAHPSRSPDIKLDNLIKLPTDFPPSNVRSRVIGSVHGLIGFQSGSHDSTSAIYIWNPSLSTIIRFPSSCSSKSYNLTFRFGFDPKSDDYKVVKLNGYLVPDMQVQVYSMRKGTWKLISKSFPSNVYPVIYQDNKVDGDHDGHVYWLCFNLRDKCRMIIGFDLCEETFFEISFPRSLIKSRSNRSIDELYLFAGKLCITSSYDDFEHEVWVMNEYGVWVKHDVLPHLDMVIDHVGFALNNEVFFKECYYDRLVLYDQDTTKVKYFDHRPVNEGSRIVQYADSLVWITPTD